MLDKKTSFSEESVIDAFMSELQTKENYYTDSSFSMKYIDDDIIPLKNIIDFLFSHHFISESGYLQCKSIYEDTIKRGKQVLEERCERAAMEHNRQAELRKEEQNEYIKNFISNHKPGDRVAIKGTLIGTNLPRYLEGGCLTIVGFTNRGNVRCKWDANTEFRISPCYLKDV